MSKSLPEPCPRVQANQPMADDPVHCRVPAIIPSDASRHQCRLKVGHDKTHVCWCGRDWEQRS